MSGTTMIMLLESFDIGKIIGTPTPTSMPGDNTGNVIAGKDYDSIWQLVGLVVILIIILVAAYYTSRFIGGIKLGQMKKSNFQVIDTYRVTANKALQLIKVGNKYLVISIGKDEINFITELEETEVIIRENNQGETQSFKQILDKLKNKNE